MALIEGCKHALELTVPLAEVEMETERAIDDIRKKVKLPGFRPGKAPASLIKSRYKADIRQQVLDKLLPRFFNEAAKKENLEPVGQPSVTDLHFHEGEPLTFTIEFEVPPKIDLKSYTDLTVEFAEPEIADADIDQRVNALRERKAEFVNEDPRPLREGDFAAIKLKSLSGVQPPMESNDLSVEIGGKETLPAFNETLLGLSPDDEREFEVTYPDDYGSEQLAGKAVRFWMQVLSVRHKELPDLNDEFAKDLGDFQSLEELRASIRKTIFGEREYGAQQEAKNKLIEQLVESNDFPIPEAFIDRQAELSMEARLRSLAQQGVDVSKLKLNFEDLKKAGRDRAIRDVKASMIVDKIAERENIHATNEEMDREIQREARQQREAAPSVRRRWEQDGTLNRLAHHFKTEKTLGFVFERARKVAPSPVTPAADAIVDVAAEQPEA